jgi:hypothetical protein
MKRVVIAATIVLIVLAVVIACRHKNQLQSDLQNAELITVEGSFPDDGHYHRIVLSRTSNPEIFDQFQHLHASYDHSAGSRLVNKCCLITAYRGLPEHVRLEAESLCQASIVTRAVYTNSDEIGVREQEGPWYVAPEPLSVFLQQQFSLSETKTAKPRVTAQSSHELHLKLSVK